MKSIASADRRTAPLPRLVNGERMKQPEFHRRYEQYPDDCKIELIGGIVYVASPQRHPHSRQQPILAAFFIQYELATPGVETLENATVILDEDREPQPDHSLRLLPECGGRTFLNPERYVVGCPELIAEIAHSTRDIDLFQKREDYETAGAKEYVVVALEEPRLHWFDFVAGNEVKPGRDGILRSRAFPGLWLHQAALLAADVATVLESGQLGLASRAHQAFVKKLAARRKS